MTPAKAPASFFFGFDLKMQLKVITGNPYDWNQIMLKRKQDKKAHEIETKTIRDLPAPELAKMNRNAHMVAEYIGIDIAREWSKYYDKVWNLYQWGKVKTKSEDINKILNFLSDRLNQAPSMNGRRIDDLFVSYKLDQVRDYEENLKKEKEDEEKSKEEELEKEAETNKEDIEDNGQEI